MNRIKNSFIVFLGLILFLCLTVSLQAQIIYKGKTPSSHPAGYQIGHMCVGDIWDSFITANQTMSPFFNNDENERATRGIRTPIRTGNIDRNWQTGNGNWPIAYPYTIWWSRYLHVIVYDSDPTFNPAQINGVDNPAYFAGSKDASGDFSRYTHFTFGPNVVGANDPTRNYIREAYFVDGTQRNHLVFESGFPTNVGIDVRMRAHQFAAPNWNNLNDFILVEVSLKNTGVVDLNLDGTPERTNHKIEALAGTYAAELAMSYNNDIMGGRYQSALVPNDARMGGYVGDDDPDGNPWNFVTAWAGATSNSPNKTDMGFSVYTNRYYVDQYHGASFLYVKKGGLPSDPTKGTYALPDKENIWGIDAIGKGKQRGWFTSSGVFVGSGPYQGNPKLNFNLAMSTWYENGGKNFNANTMSLRPNPKFFNIAQNNEFESIEKWVPKKTSDITEAERPNGDAKLISLDGVALVNVNDPDGAGYPTGWGKMSKGFTKDFNFDGELFHAVGPLSLDVNEEVTLVFAMIAGYRLEGIQKALRAARYTYDNDYKIPTPPPLPDMRVSNTLTNSIAIEWDNVAESDPNFAGYKIWKSANFMKYDYTDQGMRIVDKYQEQMVVGEDKEQFKKPINPRFDAFDEIKNASGGGKYSGYTWGTYELLKTIPKSELASYRNGTAPYTYMFDDQGVLLGFTYWYYVSAYSEGTFTGPGGETTNRIETHSTNRNGAEGLWQGTFPFCTGNAFFQANNPDWLKKAGAAIVRSAFVVENQDLNNGVKKVGVRPNPYKKAALHDNFTNVYDHKMMFYNLPAKAKVTITDVAGKIIQVIDHNSNGDPAQGSFFWDMFSKDGNEVASGLYLYYVEWDGGFDKGKFAILR